MEERNFSTENKGEAQGEVSNLVLFKAQILILSSTTRT